MMSLFKQQRFVLLRCKHEVAPLRFLFSQGLICRYMATATRVPTAPTIVHSSNIFSAFIPATLNLSI